MAAKALKAALAVATMAAAATVKSGGSAAASGGRAGLRAIKAGSGRAYSVLFEVKLTGRMSRKSRLPDMWIRGSHNRQAEKALKAFLNKPQNAGLRPAFARLRAAGGWDWHHHTKKVGVLQLVPRVQHQRWSRTLFHKASGAGGFSIWGRFFK